MHPYPFSYHRPTSIDDALAMLGQFGDTGKLLAGGHSLLPVMKLRLAQPEHLIDITGLSDLSGVRLDGDVVSIGALTTHHQLEMDAILATSAGLLPEIAHVVGDQQVRNRGTLGGALAPPTRPPITRPVSWRSTPKSWPVVQMASGRSPSTNSSLDS